MTPERWAEVERVLALALESDEHERTALLIATRRDDPDLCREVESLLRFADRSDRFLREPAICVAAKLVSDDSRLAERNLGTYRLQSTLGAGGSGTVYLAHDPQLGRKVALKVLDRGFESRDDWVRSLQEEARAASALNHPNILTIYEIGEADGKQFIAAEYVEGLTLRDRVAQGRLSLGEVVATVRQVAEALAAAHRAGIVHRDIKPENIMLRSDGYAKVLDFGLATWTDGLRAERVIETRRARGGNQAAEASPVAGTVSYMSPEQVRGGELDGRSDLFSLGVVLYETLTARKPFAGTDAREVTQAILLREPVAAERHRPEIPSALAAILRRLLAKDRDERYASAEDLLADITQLEDDLRGGTQPAAADRRARARRLALQVTGTVAIVVLLLLALARLRTGSPPPATQIRSLAVLPLQSSDNDADSAYLRHGLADSVINRLARLPDLRVMSLNSAARFADPATDIRRIARELDVEAVVSGRVESLDDVTLLSIELADGRDGRRLWGQQFRRREEDLATIQDEVARQVVEQIRHQVGAQEQLGASPKVSGEAYRQYLKGRYHWNLRTEASLRQAIEHFNLAMVEEPDYAAAYAGLADSYGLLSNYGVLRPKEAAARARVAAEKALSIDENLAEAHTSLGLVLKDHDWDFAAAAKSFERAIELNPSYATARQWYAENLVLLGEYDAALEQMRRAAELDRFSLIIDAGVGWTLLQARRYDEAAEHLRRTLELDPDFARAHFYLGRVYEQLGRWEEAERATLEAIRLSGGTALFEGSLGHIYGLSQRTEEARRILEALLSRSERDYVSPFAVVLAYIGLGDADAAFRWLERARTEMDSIFPNFLRDPQLDPLRDDERFDRVVRTSFNTGAAGEGGPPGSSG